MSSVFPKSLYMSVLLYHNHKNAIEISVTIYGDDYQI